MKSGPGTSTLELIIIITCSSFLFTHDVHCGKADIKDARRLKSGYMRIVNGGIILGGACSNFTFSLAGEVNVTHELDAEVASYSGESSSIIVERFNSEFAPENNKDARQLLSFTASLYEEAYLEKSKTMCSMKKGLICDSNTNKCIQCQSPTACEDVWKIAHAKDIDPSAPLNLDDAKEYLRLLDEIARTGQTVGQTCDVAASAEALVSSELSEEDTLLNLRAQGLDREKIQDIGENLQISRTICASKLNLACVPLYNWWDGDKAEEGAAGVVGKCKWCSEIVNDKQIYVHERFKKVCKDFVTNKTVGDGQDRFGKDGNSTSGGNPRYYAMEIVKGNGFITRGLLLLSIWSWWGL